jgi:hypothetical protein
MTYLAMGVANLVARVLEQQPLARRGDALCRPHNILCHLDKERPVATFIMGLRLATTTRREGMEDARLRVDE